MTNPEIYNQVYNRSDTQKEAICLYMGSVQMSNYDCERTIDKLAQWRQDHYGSKAGTAAYIFSTGHPQLIGSFIDHVVNTLNGTDTSAGRLYSISFNNLPEPYKFFGHTINYREGINPDNVYIGLLLDYNCKRWHFGNRHVVTLYEVLEMYKWKHGGPEIHWVSPRERRDGHFAFKAFMDTSIWRKRKTPGPPNEYVAAIRNLV
jgi:hypothetical protein